MGCNCGKGRKPLGSQPRKPEDKKKTQSFELQDRGGRTQTFSRKLDAEAARVRNGGTIRPI